MATKQLNRRDFLRAAGAGAAGLTLLGRLAQVIGATAASSPSKPPNIIFILGDDVGLGNISCYGADNFKTPQIDALAAGGTRFDYCFATPLCGPSRCALLSGRYPFRTGLIDNVATSTNRIKPANETFIPKVLKAAGYVTTSVGKWGQLPLQPSDFGFDEYLRFSGSGKYWSAADRPVEYVVNGEEKQLEQGRYMPDLMHDVLVDFITRHKDGPFFAYYSMSNIHWPLMRTPDSEPGSKDLYADMNNYMDKLVGKLMTELDRLKLRENTIVMFVGDNGHEGQFAKRDMTLNGRKIVGSKGGMLEGGSRVPMIVSWPGVTPAGKVCNDLVDLTDFLPSFAELAGAKPPAGVTLDGQSFAPQLHGQAGKPREWVYVELNFPKGMQRYVRSKEHKLNGFGELYDMSDAPFAETLIPADTKDDKAVAARKKLQQVLDSHVNPAFPPLTERPAQSQPASKAAKGKKAAPAADEE